MVAQVLSPEVHPLYDVAMCLHGASEALAGLPEGPLPQSDAHALEVVVEETTRLERKLGEFRLRVSRAAEESRAAVSTGATDTGAWLARLTGSSAAVMRGGLWLGRMLQERYPSVREAFASGGLGEDHARVIVRAAERMPRVVTDEDRQQAVSQLVEVTVERRLNVKAVRRKARRMLDRINEGVRRPARGRLGRRGGARRAQRDVDVRSTTTATGRGPGGSSFPTCRPGCC